MPQAKPTRAEMAAHADWLRAHADPGGVTNWDAFADAMNSIADAIEALMQDRAEPVAFIYADDLRQLNRTGAATVYEKQQTFRLLPEQEEIALYAAPPAKPAGELPPLELDNYADLGLPPCPETWDEDYKRIWMALQLAERHKSQWRAYALRAIQEQR